jgi:hypothetical protein
MGKGSGGCGGASGAVSYPAYIETVHTDWINSSGADTISDSVTDIMNAALGNSPWTGQLAYDPDADIAAMLASSTTLQTLVTLLSNGTTLDTLIADILDMTRIDDVVTAYEADLDTRLINEILPRFERGMQDINAVVSSAFAIGRALIEENQDRQVAKFRADLTNKAFSDDAIKVISLKLEYQRAATAMLAELYRVKIVAKKEETDVNIKIDESDAVWDLGVFQYGANLMAAPAGGTLVPNDKGPSTGQSMIGGALSGAAAGAMIAAAPGAAISGPVGIGVGAALGAASALF